MPKRLQNHKNATSECARQYAHHLARLPESVQRADDRVLSELFRMVEFSHLLKRWAAAEKAKRGADGVLPQIHKAVDAFIRKSKNRSAREDANRSARVDAKTLLRLYADVAVPHDVFASALAAGQCWRAMERHRRKSQ